MCNCVRITQTSSIRYGEFSLRQMTYKQHLCQTIKKVHLKQKVQFFNDHNYSRKKQKTKYEMLFINNFNCEYINGSTC